MDESPDAIFDSFRYRDLSSRGDAIAALAEATMAINSQLEGPTASWRERIGRWLEKLHDLVADTALRSGAETYSITVGLRSVSASLTWPVERSTRAFTD